MKKTGILALLLAGIMTASVCAVAAQAEETPKADSQAEITAEEETTRRKKPERSQAEKQITAEETETAEKATPCKGRKAKAEAAEPEGVIGKDAAKEAALADAGVEAEGHVRAKYQEKDGESTYTVRFKADGQVYKIKIDAKTGEVLEKSVTEETEESMRKGRKGSGRKTDSRISDKENAAENPEQNP